MLIDTHCHLDDARFDNERFQVIERAKSCGVKKMISIGCDIENTIRAKSIALAHPEIYFSAGIHPHEASKAPQGYYKKLKSLALHSKCVAIGECGLDYYYNHSPKEVQIEIFTSHIKLAHELKKPIVIHVRDAFEDCLHILEDQKKRRTKTIIHCFTGTLSNAKNLVDLDCTLSISGVITFANPGQLHEVIKEIPLEKFIIETDSPYLAPIPHRGKRNEPAFVRLVAEKIAELKKISLDEVILQTGKNANDIFQFN